MDNDKPDGGKPSYYDFLQRVATALERSVKLQSVAVRQQQELIGRLDMVASDIQRLNLSVKELGR